MSEEETRDLSDASKFEERLFGELASIRGEIAALGGDIAAFGSDIATIRSEIAAIRDDIAAIRDDIAKLDIRLTALEKRMTDVENRLGKLEDRVDARLLETRPIWEAVQSSIKRLDDKFDTVIQDLYELRTDSRVHHKLIWEHERRLNPSST